MHRPARPARLAAAAVAGTALVTAMLAVPSQAAPVAANGTVAASVRIVTPPTSVSRSTLVRLLRNAGKTTDKALFAGARLQNTAIVNGRTSTTIGRTRGGLASTRDENGAVVLTDYRSGTTWVRIADLVDGLGVTPEQVANALDSLGKPGATWAVITDGPGGASVTGSTEADLVKQARAASTWSWKRAKGITTWRLASPRAAMPSTTVIGLDKRQRVVRETLTTSSSKPVKATARITVLARYGSVSPIVLPTDPQSVGFTALLQALAAQPENPTVARVVGAARAQLEALRAMSGR